MKHPDLETMDTLNSEKAPLVDSVISISNPEWGPFPFHYKAQSLTDNNYAHIIGTGSNSRVLFDKEMHHWKIASYKPLKNEITPEDQYPWITGGPGSGKSYTGDLPLTFGTPLSFPLAINADWVRIQCGVDGKHNYIFGIDGLKEFYAAGAGIYSRNKEGKPNDSLEYWIDWYEKEKKERIKISTSIDEIKELLPKVLAVNNEPEFEIVKANYSFTIIRNSKKYYIEAYKFDSQKWIDAGAVTKAHTDKYPYIFQVFDNLEEGRKAIESLPLTKDEFFRLPSILRKLISQTIPRVKKKLPGIKI